MKKILVATTALIATAGMAAADVSFGGYGRFGVVHSDGDNNMHQRFRLNITAKTETTGGLAVSGTVRLQADSKADDSAFGRDLSSAKFGLAYGGFSMEVGNAEDMLFQQKAFKYQGANIGLTGISSRRHAFNDGFDRNDMGQDGDNQQRINVVYTNSGFTGAATHTLETGSNENAYTQVGVGYNFGNGTVGLGYGDSDIKGEYWVAALDMSFGDFNVGGIVGESDALDDTVYGFSADYQVGSATKLLAIYSGGGDKANDDHYGVGFIHNLGGGVTLRGAVAQVSDSKIDGGNGFTKADFGIRFDF